MELLIPKHRRNPNEKVSSLYFGVANGNRTVTQLVKASADCQRLEATTVEGKLRERGVGGQIAVLVLGGMETTLDEMEYILQAKMEKKFVARRKPNEIVAMCQLVAERRNARIKYLRKNPSEAPKKRRVRLHLPVGFRYVPTSEPGLRVLARG